MPEYLRISRQFVENFIEGITPLFQDMFESDGRPIYDEYNPELAPRLLRATAGYLRTIVSVLVYLAREQDMIDSEGDLLNFLDENGEE